MQRKGAWLLVAVLAACSRPPCDPARCFARAEALRGAYMSDRDDMLADYESACRGGIEDGCLYYAGIVEDGKDFSDAEVEHARALVHLACHDMKMSGACAGEGKRLGDLALLDRSCQMGSELGCRYAAWQRVDSADPKERAAAIPWYANACSEDVRNCSRLAELQEEAGDVVAAQATRIGACDRGERDECVLCAFDAAVGRGRAKDPEAARRYALISCPPHDECDTLEDLERFLAEPSLLLGYVHDYESMDEIQVALPPDVLLPVGSGVAQHDPSFTINGASSFEARVLSSRPGHVVVKQSSMSVGSDKPGKDGAFTMSFGLTIGPRKRALILLTAK